MPGPGQVDCNCAFPVTSGSCLPDGCNMAEKSLLPSSRIDDLFRWHLSMCVCVFCFLSYQMQVSIVLFLFLFYACQSLKRFSFGGYVSILSFSLKLFPFDISCCYLCVSYSFQKTDKYICKILDEHKKRTIGLEKKTSLFHCLLLSLSLSFSLLLSISSVSQKR